jgi:hypothetical protein
MLRARAARVRVPEHLKAVMLERRRRKVLEAEGPEGHRAEAGLVQGGQRLRPTPAPRT